MPKQNEQTEAQIKRVVNFAQHLRAKLIIPSLELENFLNFQYSQILKKNAFHCCTIEKVSVNKAFKRAFKSMSRIQQAKYYSKCVKIVLKQVYSTNQKVDNISNEEHETNEGVDRGTKKFQQLSILIKRQGSFKKWVFSKIQLASQICVMRLVHSGEELDLHNYILRESKSKEKHSLVLESTDQTSHPTTLRLSNYYESFAQLKSKFEIYIEKALRNKLINLLKRHRNSFTSIRSSFQGDVYHPDMEMQSKSFKKNKTSNQQKPATLLLVDGNYTKSMRKIILQSSKRSFPEHQYRKIYSKLTSKEKIFALSSFKDFQHISNNIYFNKKSQVTRRIFRFDESEMNYEWLVTSMNCYKLFKKWKSCLFLINLLAEFPEQKTKIYHEINLYKDYNEVDYVFLRHLFEIDGVNYYIDKSINTQEYGRVANGSRGWIEECIWRFRKIGTQIELLVQIEFGGSFNKKNVLQLAVQYIGQVSAMKKQFVDNKTMKSSTLKTVYNHNLFLFQDQSEFNGRDSQMGSPLKKKRQERSKSETNFENDEKRQEKIKKFNEKKTIQKIMFPPFLSEENLEAQNGDNFSDKGLQESRYAETQFYSIDDQRSDQDMDFDSGEQNQPQIEKELSSSQAENRQNLSLRINQSQTSSTALREESLNINLLTYPQPVRYLYYSHSVKCLDKDVSNKTKQTTEQNGHYIWRKQWKITDKGELININEEQIRVQSSVLKLVAKRMGRNLLAGKSVLNISLPIQIFGTDSNLERLCKSMAYGPKFLESAVKFSCPVERMKRVMCFALGYSICYIEMQKPFNPILGETYQGMIDGCPVYGEQISHHPPISTILFKGRGYTVYANLEAKVDMGLNSASGINDGYVNVAFSETDFSDNVIKFTCPPGQLSGLVMGERKLTITKRSFYVDEKNMLLGMIQWGSQKKKNDISFNNDYFDGQIVKLKANTDLSKLDKIKDSQFEKICSEVKGRWTNKVQFNNEILFDVQKDGPYSVDEYPYPLESNVHFREDIILRKKNDLILAQQAKQKLEQVQRNDRKLRKKYENEN